MQNIRENINIIVTAKINGKQKEIFTDSLKPDDYDLSDLSIKLTGNKKFDTEIFEPTFDTVEETQIEIEIKINSTSTSEVKVSDSSKIIVENTGDNPPDLFNYLKEDGATISETDKSFILRVDPESTPSGDKAVWPSGQSKMILTSLMVVLFL